MADPAPRRVRIARADGVRAPTAIPVPSVPPNSDGVKRPPHGRFANRGGTQRVRRLTMLYVVLLAAIYLGFVLLSRTAPGGSSQGMAQDLALFGEVALALALVGAVLTLLSAPAALEVDASGTVIIGPLGTRRRIPSGPGVSVKVVRRYPAGFLSSGPVESVEVAYGGHRHTYLVDAGLLPTAGDGAR